MRRFFLICLLGLNVIMSMASAQEKGLDPITEMTGVKLICGQINGKYIFFNFSAGRVWYILSNPQLSKKIKLITQSHELESFEAYEYNINKNNISKFLLKGGTVIVEFAYNHAGAINRSPLYLKITHPDNYRLFQGENGSNGSCRLI